MFFAFSFLVVLAILYVLVNDGFTSSSKHKVFKDFNFEKKAQSEACTKSELIDFDFETLVSPDELSILIEKTK
ncbi:hypothetical protein EYD45_06625 [Hyunsoonleella flava]|uniref:Uncharacterized protein n=1 Tax=Hyunsoonleella flava TaxID=2527939 RepID=A0A4Q9FF76_9FLAO|nr:hypothetical protein [Hyunsoonleella flava]TBN04290.1 hypothetical protein EYD45_06625 [Hyunsoonleella flava]